MNAKFVTALVVVSVSSISFRAFAQVTDPLKDIEFGSIVVAPEHIAVGLDYEEFMFGGGALQRVSMADIAKVPGNGTGLLAVAYYGGRIELYDDTGKKMATPLVDIAATNPELDVAIAHGITAMAIHPEFATLGAPGYGKFYVVETETNHGQADFVNSTQSGTHHQEGLYEYTLSAHTDVVCAAGCSKREVLRIQQPGWHHNIGDMLFGQDGMLYIASGDGSTSGTTIPIMSDNSQDLTTVFGGILRIDPLGSNSDNGRYGIPADNPFIDGSGGNVDEMYAYGLRNPYRMYLDAVTGDIYMSETGELKVESVDKLVAGGNYGWNLKEGEFLYDKITRQIFVDEDNDGNGIGDLADANNLIEPVFQYDHDDGAAVIGGVLYRGSSQPDLVGKYVFADFNGRLFYGEPNTGLVKEFVLDTSNNLPTRINSVEEDAAGEIVVLGIRMTNGVPDGVITRITGTSQLNCDFDDDLDCDLIDIDTLVAEVVATGMNLAFDLDADGVVDESDISAWLLDAGLNSIGAAYLPADANLDGAVDASDFNIWNAYKAMPRGLWSLGDFNADGDSDTSDFNIWNNFKFTSTDVVAVPEPSTFWLTILILGITGRRVWRRWTVADRATWRFA